jgi:hypothetical protein
VGSKLKDAVSEKVDEAGGAGDVAKDVASGLIPGSGGDGGGGKGGMPGVGNRARPPASGWRRTIGRLPFVDVPRG